MYETRLTQRAQESIRVLALVVYEEAPEYRIRSLCEKYDVIISDRESYMLKRGTPATSLITKLVEAPTTNALNKVLFGFGISRKLVRWLDGDNKATACYTTSPDGLKLPEDIY